MVDFGLVEYGQNVNKVGYSLAQVSILTYQKWFVDFPNENNPGTYPECILQQGKFRFA